MRKQIIMIFVVVFALFACAASTMAAGESRIVYVNCNATGDNTGSSWDKAFTTLQAALEVAQPGDEIWVAEGTYKPTSDYGLGIGERGKHFEMKNGVGIYGGFAGTESARSGRDWTAHPTILSGDIGLVGDDSDNSYHVFYHPDGLALNQTTVLDGFTVTGGNANSGDSASAQGGGMYNYNNSPALTNVTFSENHSGYNGGGMSNDHYSSPTLANVTFSGNTTSGIEGYKSNVYGFGGGMSNDHYSSPTLTNVTFSGNSAFDSGGGMSNYSYSNPTLTNVTFSNNSGGSGGGMSNDHYSSPTLTNVTLSGNSASYYGGGMANDESNPTLTNVTLSGNSASYYGGGMYNYSYSNPTLTNVTFSGNNAIHGGGMSNDFYSRPTLTNVTFSGNSASGGGGGMNNHNSSPTLTNCILWGNSVDQIYNESSSPTVTYSDIQGSYPGNGNIDADPLFVGPGNLRLQADSPCINTGSNDAVTVTTDLDGNPRIVSFNVDMGAYEFSGPFPPGSPTWPSGSSLTASNVTQTGLTLTWTAATDDVGVTSYKIYKNNNLLENVNLDTVDGTPTPYIVTGLTAGTQYAFKVEAGDAAGNWSTGPSVTVTTATSAPGGGEGRIIYVNWNATGDNTGSSWGNAFTTLQAALDVAQPGREVWVAAGTYKPTSDYGLGIGERGKHFRMKNGVGIYGGFAGTESARSGRDWNANPTILSGDIGIEGNASDNYYYHVFYHPDGLALNQTAVLDGFTVTGGNANSGDSTTAHGGGMYNYNNSPALTNVTFSGNHSGYNGGGMANDESSPTLTNVTFSGNSAGRYGGGMYNRGGSPTLTNVTFSENNAGYDGGGMRNLISSPTLTNVTFSGNNAGYDGGGMANDESSPTLTNVTFSGNNADYSGGGMRNSYSSPTLTNVTFSENKSSSYGGGMFNQNNSNPTLTNVTFSGNNADYDGGGMYNGDGSPALTNVTFSGNTAAYHGGGMCNLISSPTLINVTFSNNSGSYGGGMYNNRSSPMLTNVTFNGNSSSGSGGGMYNDHYSSPTLTNVTFNGNSSSWDGGGIYNTYNSSPALTNCILWGNGGDQIYDTLGGSATVTYSDIQGGWVGEGNINTNPKFVRNPSNDNFGDLRLQADSPCINAGTNVPFEAGGVAQGVTTDLDGNPRIIGNRVDMGAYEAEAGIITDPLSNLISKFQKLSPEQVKAALAIGRRIIESDTIPDILSPAQKSLLNNLGLTNAQVKSAYNSVISQLDTEEKIKDLQSGDLTKLTNFLKTVEGNFDPDLRNTLAAKGITVSKVVNFALDIANLTFDPFSNIPKAELEAILEGDLGIASATAASYGLNWANIEALRDSLHPPEKHKLKDILITLGNLSDSANLSGLTVSTGTLDPVLAPDTTGYTVIVGSDVSGFTVTPTTADASAAVEVDKKTVQSGTASETISFRGNSRKVKVTVTVTAPSGTEKNYILTVIKPK